MPGVRATVAKHEINLIMPFIVVIAPAEHMATVKPVAAKLTTKKMLLKRCTTVNNFSVG
jgi:hypothetical protein